jgi:hypothetical protein
MEAHNGCSFIFGELVLQLYCSSDMLTCVSLQDFEVLTVVTMRNAVFWDVKPCGSCKSPHFGGTKCFHHRGDKNW